MHESLIETPEDVDRQLAAARAALRDFEGHVDSGRLLLRLRTVAPAHPLLLVRFLFGSLATLCVLVALVVLVLTVLSEDFARAVASFETVIPLPESVPAFPALLGVLALSMGFAWLMVTLAALALARDAPMLAWEHKQFQKLVNDVTRLTTQKAVMERIRNTPAGARPRIATPIPVASRRTSPSYAGGGYYTTGVTGLGHSPNALSASRAAPLPVASRGGATPSEPYRSPMAPAPRSGQSLGFDPRPSLNGMVPGPLADPAGPRATVSPGGSRTDGQGNGFGPRPVPPMRTPSQSPSGTRSPVGQATGTARRAPTVPPRTSGRTPTNGTAAPRRVEPTGPTSPAEPHTGAQVVPLSVSTVPPSGEWDQPDDAGTEAITEVKADPAPARGSPSTRPRSVGPPPVMRGGQSRGPADPALAGPAQNDATLEDRRAPVADADGILARVRSGALSGTRPTPYGSAGRVRLPPPAVTIRIGGPGAAQGHATRGGTPLGAPPKAGVPAGQARRKGPERGHPTGGPPERTNPVSGPERAVRTAAETPVGATPAQTAPRSPVDRDPFGTSPGFSGEPVNPSDLFGTPPSAARRETSQPLAEPQDEELSPERIPTAPERRSLPALAGDQEPWLLVAVQKARELNANLPAHASVELSKEPHLPFTLVLDHASPAVAVRAMINFVEFLANVPVPQRARIDLRGGMNLDRSFYKNVEAALEPYFADAAEVRPGPGQVDIRFRNPDPRWSDYAWLPLQR